MPLSFFTTALRSEVAITEVFPHAELLSTAEDQETYMVDGCKLTLSFWLAGGDRVSHLILGCHNAIRTGRLACADRETAMATVLQTKTAFGMVGDKLLLGRIAEQLSKRFPGVVITSTHAIVVGY